MFRLHRLLETDNKIKAMPQKIKINRTTKVMKKFCQTGIDSSANLTAVYYYILTDVQDFLSD